MKNSYYIVKLFNIFNLSLVSEKQQTSLINEKDYIDDRLATCLITVRINKTNNKYKGEKNE